MSHFTRVRTKLTSREYVKKALERMGLSVEEGNFTISQYGTSEKAEIRIDKAVGLQRQKDGTWSMVGDFYHADRNKLRKYYGSTGNKKFTKELSTGYAVEQSKGELTNNHFYCSSNAEGKVGADGKIRMVFESYA